jgi:hypothetical protein|tara:strand:- start:674 stop:961 length:288 start_codon:yes stop_codon:yes gene_type:complete
MPRKKTTRNYNRKTKAPDLKYTTKMKKKKGEIIWQVIEHPTKSIILESFFEEDAQRLADFQNKNQVWKYNGGLPGFLCVDKKTSLLYTKVGPKRG